MTKNNFVTLFDKIMRKPFSTEELYRRAQTHNWDEGFKFLRNILEHQNCDRGTALMMYWNSNPEYFTKYESEDELQSWEKSNYRFIKMIEEKYPTIEQEFIIYDPYEDEKVGLHKGKFEVKKILPEIMYQKTKGSRYFKEVEKGIW